jgi:membrane protein implicated in regulation of membrane protease activity
MPPARASTRRVFARYLAAEVPSWIVLGVVLAVLMHAWDLSGRAVAITLGLWVLKDLALFPALRIAYEPGGGSGGAENLIGELAVVSVALDPEGWVRIGSERWRARAAQQHAPLPVGAEVRVLAIEGLLLRVEPAPR